MNNKDLQSLLKTYHSINENDKLRGLQSFFSYTRIKRKFTRDEFEINPQMKSTIEVIPKNVFESLGDPSETDVTFYDVHHTRLFDSKNKNIVSTVITVSWYFELEDNSLGSIYTSSKIPPFQFESEEGVLNYFKTITSPKKFYIHFGTLKPWPMWIKSEEDEKEQRARTKIKIEKLIPQAQILSISRS
jgi:hypothetical protein